MPRKPKTKKQELVSVEFERNGGEQFLTIKVDKQIQEIFAHEIVKESNRYRDEDGDPIDYCGLTKKLDKIRDSYNKSLRTQVSRSEALPVALKEYGSSLVRSDSDEYRYANLSILRTVDLAEGITVNVDELILESDINLWVASMSRFVKYVFNEFTGSEKIEARLVITRQA